MTTRNIVLSDSDSMLDNIKKTLYSCSMSHSMTRVLQA